MVPLGKKYNGRKKMISKTAGKRFMGFDEVCIDLNLSCFETVPVY